MKKGYENTLKFIPQIKARVQREESKQERENKRESFKKKIPPLIFNDIEVTGTQSNRIKNYISRQFDLRDGDTLNIEDVKKSYYKLLSDARLDDPVDF